jgi:NAD(P)H-flavin reductase
MSVAEPNLVPEPLRVLAVREETRDVVTLTLEAGSKARRSFSPGQFNMLYVFGVGEVAVSMSGDPARSDVLVHTVKAVGKVTEALCRLQPGSRVGVRGPFGVPWPTSEVRGADLLLVAGGLGLAPVWPVVHDVLARRSAYGRVYLLVGARSPEELLFRSELDDLQHGGALTVLTTVDRAPLGWKGPIGVVPALISEVTPGPGALAFVCGPEVMMRYSARALERCGLPVGRVFLSMERNMKCAVGFCGHCQYQASFICKDGPVIRYDRLRPLLQVSEI